MEKLHFKKNNIIKLSALWHFLIFFMLIAFVVTCNFLLFLNQIEYDVEKIGDAAGVTFANVLLLTVIFCVIDAVRRRETVTKPVRHIRCGIDNVIKGDFSQKISYIYHEDSNNEFDLIIGGLNKMIEELSGVETLQNDFIANVSHELKTPLAAIQNYSMLLQDTQLSHLKRIEYAKAIQEQCVRLSKLITNILKINKLENQQIYPNVEKYYIGEQLCECMLEFENVWEEKNIDIEADIEDDILIEADRELLSLVWNNLLSNALKFTGEYGKIKIKLKSDNEFIYVNIEDNGCGMTEETGKNIFKKFYQGDTSHKMNGNGLGLALVKRVIDICGAEISVSSRLGDGSTFIVKLRRDLDEIS